MTGGRKSLPVLGHTNDTGALAHWPQLDGHLSTLTNVTRRTSTCFFLLKTVGWHSRTSSRRLLEAHRTIQLLQGREELAPDNRKDLHR
mmetsp:Transcript_54008/g.89138  ORF Transcript_54008/g.89138 Transcript_54008/m.89138 type:complete len:88 (+) Transcript_54008:274-537(+)